jgi:hypothetical protein
MLHVPPISFLILSPAQYWVRNTEHEAPHYEVLLCMVLVIFMCYHQYTVISLWSIYIWWKVKKKLYLTKQKKFSLCCTGDSVQILTSEWQGWGVCIGNANKTEKNCVPFNIIYISE